MMQTAPAAAAVVQTLRATKKHMAKSLSKNKKMNNSSTEMPRHLANSHRRQRLWLMAYGLWIGALSLKLLAPRMRLTFGDQAVSWRFAQGNEVMRKFFSEKQKKQ